MGIWLLAIDDIPCGRALLASTFLARLRGMLGRKPLPEAMLFTPCGSVHGLGMRDTLDVAFLSTDGTVLAVGLLKPGRLLNAPRHTRSTLEAPAGSFGRWGLTVGSLVTLTRRE
jgi:uncharacterized membrane protein (UPF0127 family)